MLDIFTLLTSSKKHENKKYVETLVVMNVFRAHRVEPVLDLLKQNAVDVVFGFKIFYFVSHTENGLKKKNMTTIFSTHIHVHSHKLLRKRNESSKVILDVVFVPVRRTRELQSLDVSSKSVFKDRLCEQFTNWHAEQVSPALQ